MAANLLMHACESVINAQWHSPHHIFSPPCPSPSLPLTPTPPPCNPLIPNQYEKERWCAGSAKFPRNKIVELLNKSKVQEFRIEREMHLSSTYIVCAITIGVCKLYQFDEGKCDLGQTFVLTKYLRNYPCEAYRYFSQGCTQSTVKLALMIASLKWRGIRVGLIPLSTTIKTKARNPPVGGFYHWKAKLPFFAKHFAGFFLFK